MRATEIKTADAMRSHTIRAVGVVSRRSSLSVPVADHSYPRLTSLRGEATFQSRPATMRFRRPEDVGVDSRPLVPSRNAPRAVA